VGTVLDTTVFVEFERATRALPAEHAMQTVGERLVDRLGSDEEVAIAIITASELLHAVHRATEEHRARREAFVAAVLGRISGALLRFAYRTGPCTTQRTRHYRGG
jgi:predicted nucleic acid-binding protein